MKFYIVDTNITSHTSRFTTPSGVMAYLVAHGTHQKFVVKEYDNGNLSIIEINDDKETFLKILNN